MQRRLARHAWLQLDGCAHGSSIAWHLMPSFVSVTVCNAAALGMSRLASTRWLRTCDGSSITWHVMPSFISVTACNAAALGTSACLTSNQWLRTWQQHNLAMDALLQNQWPGLPISCQPRAWPESPSAPAWTGLDVDACWVNIHTLVDWLQFQASWIQQQQHRLARHA